ncbi:MAG: winged helix-turn-helix domain-containing protein [Richelia sp.]|nr:winged helix-turn-helix domain-containing protein [Richelia sp.]CDN12305.1 hypothetical protein RintRC_4786 [Richelia intracellularis]
MKRLVAWIEEKLNLKCCRESVRKTLNKLGFSRNKARKILNKANGNKRREYLKKLESLLDDALNKGHLYIFILIVTKVIAGLLEVNVFGLVPVILEGQRFVSFYGVYVYNYAQVKIFPYSKADQFNSIEVLKNLRSEFHPIFRREFVNLMVFLIHDTIKFTN